MKSEATFTLGTLDGRLNRAQTQHVIAHLQARHPRAIFDMVTVADPVSNRRSASELYNVSSPSEVDVLLTRLRDGEYQILDVAAEDLAHTLPDDVEIAAVLPRATPFDALLHKSGTIADDLPENTRVGVLSQRSQAQIAALWPALKPKLIYGGTVKALDAYLQNDEVDALVIPAAAAERLGVQDLVSEIFFPEMMLPGAGQGTIALLCRRGDETVLEACRAVHSELSCQEMLGELAFRERICSDQDCPVGVLAHATEDDLVLTGAIGSPSGSSQDQAVIRGSGAEAVALGQRLAERLLMSTTSLVDLLEADFPDGLPEGDDDEDLAHLEADLDDEADAAADLPDDDPMDDYAEPLDY